MLGRRLPGHSEAARTARSASVRCVRAAGRAAPPGRVGQRLEDRVVVGHELIYAGNYLHVKLGRYGRRHGDRRARRRRRRPPVLARARSSRAGRRARALPAAARAGEGVAVLRRRGGALRRALAARATRCPSDERLARPGPARRPGLPDAAVPAQGGHGRLAQRLVGGVRRARPAGPAVGDLLPRARGAVLRRRGADPARGSSRCTCRWAVRPARPAARPVWAPARGDRHAGGHPLRLGAAQGEHTGPGPVAGLLERHPRLQLVIAHLGMPEYREFLELAERSSGCTWTPRCSPPTSPSG